MVMTHSSQWSPRDSSRYFAQHTSSVFSYILDVISDFFDEKEYICMYVLPLYWKTFSTHNVDHEVVRILKKTFCNMCGISFSISRSSRPRSRSCEVLARSPGWRRSKSKSPDPRASTSARSASTDGTSSSSSLRKVEGGFKTQEDVKTYVRGRGRGRYVCESCGIRCKKPSMLKVKPLSRLPVPLPSFVIFFKYPQPQIVLNTTL